MFELCKQNLNEYNKALMKIKIKEILSSPITKKIKNCERDHNEKVIEKYYEKNYVKKMYHFLIVNLRKALFI